MKIAVLSCSLKKELSLSLKSAEFLYQMFPEHQFETIILNPANGHLTDENINLCKNSDLILFVSSLYHMGLNTQTLHAMSQLAEACGAYKPVTLFTTSNYLGDNMAHQCFRIWAENSHMNYIEGLSFFTEDVWHSKYLEEMKTWFDYVLEQIEYGGSNILTLMDKNGEPMHLNIRIVDVDDEANENTSDIVLKYKQTFGKYSSCDVQVVKLRDYKFSPCLGCLRCYTTKHCIIDDEFDDSLDAVYKGADIIVYVGSIENGIYNPLYHKWIHRHVQFGRMPADDERIYIYSYRHGVSYKQGDEALFQEWTSLYTSFGGSYRADFCHGYSDQSVVNALLAAKTKRMPQRNMYWSCIRTKFADLARELQNLDPTGYQYFKNQGMYEVRPVCENAKPVHTAEDAKISSTMRTVPFNHFLDEFDMSKVPDTERRIDKNLTMREHALKICAKPESEQNTKKQGVFAGLFGKKNK